MSDMNPPDGNDPAGGWSSPPAESMPGEQPSPAYGTAPGAPMSDFGQPLAEWWKRLVAIIIDSLVVGIPAGIIFGILGIGFGNNVSVNETTGEVTGLGSVIVASLVSSLVYQVVFLIYFAVMNGSERGQTVGKMAMNIRVRKGSGGPLGVGPAALRYIVYGALSLLTCGIGGLLDGLWPLWDAKRQALHDKAVSSVVVDA